jgi:hypothetical protein
MIGLVPQIIDAYPSALIDAIQRAGLQSGVQLALDAGDSRSYDGSSQTWLDLSGNSHDFYLGVGATVTANNPTFTGVAGRQTVADYFLFDGGDWFVKTTANDAFLNSLHKNNAEFTLIQWVYADVNGSTDACGLVATVSDVSAGIQISNRTATSSGLVWRLNVWDDINGSPIRVIDSTIAMTNLAWNMVAISFTESTGAGLWRINGNEEAIAGATYPSPASSDASGVAIGALVNTATPAVIAAPDCRISALAMWNRALTSAELLRLYDVTRTKFGN